MPTLKTLSVRHDNTGWGPAWHLQKVSTHVYDVLDDM